MAKRRLTHLVACLALGFALVLVPLAAPAVADDAKTIEGAKPASERVPFLWEVDTNPKIYLFGTIHVNDPRVLDHPPVVLKALEESQALYTELDFVTAQAAMMKFMMIPDGKTLNDLAPKEVVEKLNRVLEANGIPAAVGAQFQRIRPWMTAIQVPLVVSTMRKAKEAAAKAAEAGAEQAAAPSPASQLPLDLQLYMQARQKQKVVGGLELPEEQFSVFNDLSMEKQIEMLSASLDVLEKAATAEDKAAADPLEGLIKLYLAGDGAGFARLMKAEMATDPEARALMVKLLDDRNIVMVRRMLEAAQKHPKKTMFVAVGAAHYAGDVGILKLLRDTGFRVRRLNTLEAMNAPWPKADVPVMSTRAAPPRRRRIRIGPFCLPDWCCPR